MADYTLTVAATLDESQVRAWINRIKSEKIQVPVTATGGGKGLAGQVAAAVKKGGLEGLAAAGRIYAQQQQKAASAAAGATKSLPVGAREAKNLFTDAYKKLSSAAATSGEQRYSDMASMVKSEINTLGRKSGVADAWRNAAESNKVGRAIQNISKLLGGGGVAGNRAAGRMTGFGIGGAAASMLGVAAAGTLFAANPALGIIAGLGGSALGGWLGSAKGASIADRVTRAYNTGSSTGAIGFKDTLSGDLTSLKNALASVPGVLKNGLSGVTGQLKGAASSFASSMKQAAQSSVALNSLRSAASAAASAMKSVASGGIPALQSALKNVAAQLTTGKVGQALAGAAQRVSNATGNYIVGGLTEDQQQAWAQRASGGAYAGKGGYITGLGQSMLNRGNRQMGGLMGYQMMFGYAKQMLSSMFEYTLELDNQMRVYRKLLPDWNQKDMTDYIWKLGSQGNNYGKTTAAMTEASMLLTRSGYGGTTKQLQDINEELTISSVLLSNIADEEMSVGDASDSIVAVGKAWQVTDEDMGEFAAHYVDAVNEISNHMAVTSNDLTENISKTSSAMAVGGNTLDETLAMMTAMTEVNRNAAKSATALRTLQSRFTQITQFKQGSTTSTGEWLYGFFDEHGIQMFEEGTDQLRSFYDVWSDLASINEETGKSVWESLDQDEQKMFLLKAAGANRSSEAAALLVNWQNVDKAIKLAEQSAGSAEASNEVMLDSIQGKLWILQSSWETFSVKAMKSDQLKVAIMGLVHVLDALNNPLGRSVALWGAVAMAASGAYAIFRAMAMLTLGTLLRDVGALIGLLSRLGAFAAIGSVIGSIATAIGELGTAYGILTAPVIGASIAGLIASFLILKDAVEDTSKAASDLKLGTEQLNDVEIANDRVKKLKDELEELKASGAEDVEINVKIGEVSLAEDVRNRLGAEYFETQFGTNAGGSPYSAVELANRKLQPEATHAVVQSRMQADQGGVAGTNKVAEAKQLIGDLATEQERYNKALIAYGSSSAEAASCQERVNNAMEPAQDYFHSMQDTLEKINPDLDTYSEQLSYLQEYDPGQADIFETMATSLGEADDEANALAQDFDAVADAAESSADAIEDAADACSTLAGSVGALDQGAKGIAALADVRTDLFGGTDSNGNAVTADGKLTWESISSLYENFGTLEGFDGEGGYLDTLLGGADVTAAQQEATLMEMMHNKVLELAGGYEGLAAVDERVLTAFLEQAGVTDAATTSQEWLAEAIQKTDAELERQLAALNSQTDAQKEATAAAEEAASVTDLREAYDAGDNLAFTQALKDAGAATDTEINVDKFAELAAAMGLSADEASELLGNLQLLNGWKLVDNTGNVLELADALDAVKAACEPIPAAFEQAFSSIGDTIKNAFSGIGELAYGAMDTVVNALRAGCTAIEQISQGDFEGAMETIKTAWDDFLYGTEDKELEVDVEADTEGAESDIESLGEGEPVTVPVKFETEDNLDFSGFNAGDGPVVPVKADTSQAEGEIASLDGETVTVDVEADTSGLAGATDGLEGGQVTIPVVPQLDSSALNPVDILKMGQGPISIPVNADTSQAEGAIEGVSAGLTGLESQGANPTITAKDSASGTISSVSTALTNLNNKTATVHINIVKTGDTDIPKKAGDSNFKGGGVWLGDEYMGGSVTKPELVVTPDGNAHLAGLTGWEHEVLPAGSRIYSNSQTKQMLGSNYKGKRFKDGTEGKRFAAGTGSNGIVTWNIGNVADDTNLILANIKSTADYIEDIKENISDTTEKYTALVATIDDEITLEGYAEDLYDGVSDLHKELLKQKQKLLEKEKEELEAASATVENSDDYRTVLEDILKVKKEIVAQDVAELEHEKELIENQIQLLGTIGNIAGRAQGGVGQKGATMLPEDYANTMIEMYKKEQEIFHRQAEIYRANMYDEESEEIQELQTSWWQTQDKIIDIIQDLADTVAEEFSTTYSDKTSSQDYITWFYGKMKENLDIQVDYMQDEYDKKMKILNEQDEAIERQKQIQDAEADLVKAQKKRTMVMDESGKWTWKSDTQAVQDATKSLNDVKDSISKELRNELYEQELEDEKNAVYAAYYGEYPTSDNEEINAKAGQYVTSQAEADYLRTVEKNYKSIYAYVKAIEENQDANGQLTAKAIYDATYGEGTEIEGLRALASTDTLRETTKSSIDSEVAAILKQFNIVADKDANGNVDIQQGINELLLQTDANGQLSNDKLNAIRELEQLRVSKIETTGGKLDDLIGVLGTESAIIAQGILTSSGNVADEVASIKKDDASNKLYLEVQNTTKAIKNQLFDVNVEVDDSLFDTSVSNFNTAINNYGTASGKFSSAVDKFSETQNTTPQYVSDFKTAVEGAQEVVQSNVTTSENYEKYLKSSALSDASTLVKTLGSAWSGEKLTEKNGNKGFEYYIAKIQTKIDSGKYSDENIAKYQSVITQLQTLQKAYNLADNGDVYGASQAITSNSEFTKIYEAITGKNSAIYQAIYNITDKNGNLITSINSNSDHLLERLKNIDTTTANGGTISETVNTDALTIARKYLKDSEIAENYVASNGTLNIQAVMDYMKSTYYTGGKHENAWEKTTQANDYTALAALRQVKIAVEDGDVEAAIALMNGDVGNAIVTNFGTTSQTFQYLAHLEKLDNIESNTSSTAKALTEDTSKLLTALGNIDASSITAEDMQNIMTRINMDAGSIAARYGMKTSQIVDGNGNINIQAIMDKIKSQHYSKNKFDTTESYQDYMALAVLKDAKLAVQDSDAATLLSNVQAGTDALNKGTGGSSSVLTYLSGINSKSNSIKTSLTETGAVGSAISDMKESLSNIDSNTLDSVSALKAINSDAATIANEYGIQLENDAEGNVNIMALANAIKEQHYGKSGWDSTDAQEDYNTVLALRSMKIAVQDDNLATLVGLMQADTGGILSNLGSTGSTYKYLASINKNTGIEAGTVDSKNGLATTNEKIDKLLSNFASNYNTNLLNGNIANHTISSLRAYVNESGAYSVDYAIEQLENMSYIDKITMGVDKTIAKLKEYKNELETLGYDTSYDILDSYYKYSTGNQYSSSGKYTEIDPSYVIDAMAYDYWGYTTTANSNADHVQVNYESSFNKMINAAADTFGVTLDANDTYLEKVQEIFEKVSGTDFTMQNIYDYLQQLTKVSTESEYQEIAAVESLISSLRTATSGESDIIKWFQSMGAEVHGMYTATEAEAAWNAGGDALVEFVNNMYGQSFTTAKQAKAYAGNTLTSFLNKFNAANTTNNVRTAQSVKYGDYTIVIENVEATNADELLETLQNLSYTALQKGMQGIGLQVDYT